MNVWALERDDAIKVLLLRLNQLLGPDRLVLSARQDVDGRAVRLATEADSPVSAYLYTYGQDAGRCGVHLEFPQHRESDISSSLDVYENIAVESLAEMLRVHFDLLP